MQGLPEVDRAGFGVGVVEAQRGQRIVDGERLDVRLDLERVAHEWTFSRIITRGIPSSDSPDISPAIIQ